MNTKRIEYEDDIVVVFDSKGNEIYRGLEDYEPCKYEDWRWDEEKGYYSFDGMIKKCLAI